VLRSALTADRTDRTKLPPHFLLEEVEAPARETHLPFGGGKGLTVLGGALD
jgi:hypothetical protein